MKLSNIFTTLVFILASTAVLSTLSSRPLKWQSLKSELVTDDMKDGDRQHSMSARSKFDLCFVPVVWSSESCMASRKCMLSRIYYISEQNKGPPFILVLD